VRYQHVSRHGAGHPVRWMCSALKVSTSGYYSWLRRPESTHRREDRRLLTEIRASFEASHRTYGSPRVHKDLRALDYRCAKKRVARIMRQTGLRATPRRKYRYTTDSDHGLPIAGNLLERRFTCQETDRVWVADTTYISTEEGWLYLAVLMDLCSRRIVGWNTSSRNDRHLVLGALQQALVMRQPKPGLVHHSDRGSTYAAYEYQTQLAAVEAVCSMSRKGDCWDNAVAESFFATLKLDLIYRETFRTRREARQAIFNYIEVFYNRQRRHSYLGYLSPAEYEAQNPRNRTQAA